MDRIFCDPEVMQYSLGLKTPLWVRKWLSDCLDDYTNQGFGLWAVVEKASGNVIGNCGLSHLPDIDGKPEIEIGYRLARLHWGRGYATEAARAARDHAFWTLKIPRLIALIDPPNVARSEWQRRLACGMRRT